jgi:hypothetical protein
MSGTGSAPHAVSGFTPVDLYRNGNSQNARMDHVRAADITISQINGVDWVCAAPGDGVSTFEGSQGRGRLWHLPKGTPIPPSLVVRNDYTGHWVWEPAQDMPLDDYRAALSSLHPHFR